MASIAANYPGLLMTATGESDENYTETEAEELPDHAAARGLRAGYFYRFFNFGAPPDLPENTQKVAILPKIRMRANGEFRYTEFPPVTEPFDALIAYAGPRVTRQRYFVGGRLREGTIGPNISLLTPTGPFFVGPGAGDPPVPLPPLDKDNPREATTLIQDWAKPIQSFGEGGEDGYDSDDHSGLNSGLDWMDPPSYYDYFTEDPRDPEGHGGEFPKSYSRTRISETGQVVSSPHDWNEVQDDGWTYYDFNWNSVWTGNYIWWPHGSDPGDYGPPFPSSVTVEIETYDGGTGSTDVEIDAVVYMIPFGSGEAPVLPNPGAALLAPGPWGIRRYGRPVGGPGPAFGD